jgi:hypothetical protein
MEEVREVSVIEMYTVSTNTNDLITDGAGTSSFIHLFQNEAPPA